MTSDRTGAISNDSTPRVRIREVAERAGVSVGTVSNTINHPERVSSDTQAVVRGAIRALGFVPNQQARVLMGAPSNVIGLVVVDVLSPFFMEIAHAVERAARESGHVVILCNSENDHAKEFTLLQMLAAQRVRGALLTPAGGGEPTVDGLHGFPVVYLDYKESSAGCSVSVDHVAGGRLAAQHLLSLGHKKLAFVGGLPGLQQFELRARGMHEAIVEAGLDPSEALVSVHEEGIGLESGTRAAQRLLKDGLPSGICCGNDMLAFGVFRELRRHGVRIPEDVALVGYDDVEFAESWIVPLSSVRQPTQEMGRRAAQLLLEHAVGDPHHRHQQIVLQPQLIVRNTSAAT
ncbi:MAG: LacI family DNA-binding transcriptional regulator [Arachnia sp.]